MTTSFLIHRPVDAVAVRVLAAEVLGVATSIEELGFQQIHRDTLAMIAARLFDELDQVFPDQPTKENLSAFWCQLHDIEDRPESTIPGYLRAIAITRTRYMQKEMPS